MHISEFEYVFPFFVVTLPAKMNKLFGIILFVILHKCTKYFNELEHFVWINSSGRNLNGIVENPLRSLTCGVEVRRDSGSDIYLLHQEYRVEASCEDWLIKAPSQCWSERKREIPWKWLSKEKHEIALPLWQLYLV